MSQIEITCGTKKVIATRNDGNGKWSARLYLNGGDTVTMTSGSFKTEKGLRTWAAKVMA